MIAAVHHHGRGDDPAGDRDDVPAAEDGVHPDPDPGGGAVAEPGPRATLRGRQVTSIVGFCPSNISLGIKIGVSAIAGIGPKSSIIVELTVGSIYRFTFEIFSVSLHDKTGKVTFIERV